MNRSKYTAAVLLIFIRDTAVEPDIPKRKQIEVDAAVKSLGLDPSELSFDEKRETFRDLAEMRVLHNDGERWFLAPELADWMRLPEDALESAESAGEAPGEGEPGSEAPGSAEPARSPPAGDDESARTTEE